MSEYLIYVRKNSGICDKIAINENSTIGQLRRKLSNVNTTDLHLQLYFKGAKLSEADDNLSIRGQGIPNNSIIELQWIPIQSSEQKYKMELELVYNSNSVKKVIDTAETIAQLRAMVSGLFEVHPNRVKIFNDSVKISDLELKAGEMIIVKDKKLFTNLLGPEESEVQPNPLFASKKRIRIVESIASSEDPLDELIGSAQDQNTFLRKQYRSQIVKKRSQQQDTSSLKKIEEREQQQSRNNNKRSAIVSNNITSSFLNSPTIHRSPYIQTPPTPPPHRSNKQHLSDPLRLNQIRETMSFGSLQSQFEEQNPNQLTVELHSPNRYYKLACVSECTIQSIKDKISRIERIDIKTIEFEGKYDCMIEIGELYLKIQQRKQLMGGVDSIVENSDTEGHYTPDTQTKKKIVVLEFRILQ